MTNSSFDFYDKKDFFVDLDDTLINTSEANKLGLIAFQESNATPSAQ